MRRKTKLFFSGNSQALRLPKDFRFDCEEVFIEKNSDGSLIVSSTPKSWKSFFVDEKLATKDFLSDRNDVIPQLRDNL